VPGEVVNFKDVSTVNRKIVPLNRAVLQVYASSKTLHVGEQVVVLGNIYFPVNKTVAACPPRREIRKRIEWEPKR
jgi:hypothetical protein